MILLSLVGEQPIPLLLPLWQDASYKAVQFAATPVTRPVAETLAAAVRGDPQLRRLEVLPALIVPAYDIGAARAAMAQTIAQYHRSNQALVVNITGGTKLMSLAAVQAAFGSDVPLLYVSTEQDCIIHMGSDAAEQSRTPIQVKITCEQYLSAHGLEVSENVNFNPYQGRHIRPDQQGDALEETVERQARQSGFFDDVRRGLYIRKLTPRGPVVNELDVVAARNGRLAVCSCKSGKKMNRESLYELASLSRREAAGIYCGKMMATDLPELSKALRDRAADYHIHLVYGAEINHAASHLKAALK